MYLISSNNQYIINIASDQTFHFDPELPPPPPPPLHHTRPNVRATMWSTSTAWRSPKEYARSPDANNSGTKSKAPNRLSVVSKITTSVRSRLSPFRQTGH